MKVLLINPPIKNIIDSEIPSFVKQNEGFFPPLGLMYLASYLKKYTDCEVRILDAVADEMDYDAIERYVRDFHPAVVGITGHTHNLVDVILLSDTVKKVDSNIYICLGGPHVNAFPHEGLDIRSVDCVIFGEGEEAFSELIKCIEEKGEPEKIKGILFRRNGRLIRTEERNNIEDINQFPFPDRALINTKKYSSILGKRSVMTTMVTSRGCPYQCSFCSTPRGFYRMRSPENIVDEMEGCMKFGIKEIHFVDDTFNISPERVINLCNEIGKRRLNVKWSFRGRIDTITEPLLIIAKGAGCYRIHLGVETSTDEGLAGLRKNITVSQIRQVFRWTRNIGINTVAYFMIGCPHERNRRDVMRTVNFAKEIDPDFALFNILMPYPATELYEEGLRRGVLKKDFWRDFVLNPSPDFEIQFWQEWFSKKELCYLLKFAYRKFYLRPKFIFRNLNTLRNPRLLVKKLKTGLEMSILSCGKERI